MDGAVDFADSMACPECGSPERRETDIERRGVYRWQRCTPNDIERRGVYLDYKYICTDCGNAWTITEREEER